MTTALSTGANSVVCSHKSLSPVVHTSAQIRHATFSLRSSGGGFRPMSLSLQAGRTRKRWAFSRHPPVRVQAAKQTFSSFDDLLENSKQPLLVDFYATWCGPCQYMVPILENVGRVLKDKIRVVKIDTEKYPNIASRYGVQALPTFIIFKNGQPSDRFEGAMPADQLIQHIEKVLKVAK